jgi:peptidoglycan hydrolase CwlO-like protein
MLAKTKIKTKSKREKTKVIKSLEKTALSATHWIGSIESLIIHTIVFISAFLSILFGVSFDRVLLALTTVLSLEAIYLAIFIQMSVNQNTMQLAQVEKDVEEIQEDIEEIEEHVEEIAEDVDEIAEDVDEIQADVEHIEKDIDEIQEDVEGIEKDVEEIADDVEELSEEEKK